MTERTTRKKLSDTNVLNEPVGDSIIKIWDTMEPGFHLRITKAGTKSFAVTFQVKGEKGKANFTIGKVAEWTVKDARAEAKKLREKHGSDEGGLKEALKKEAEEKQKLAAKQMEEASRTLNEWVKVWREKYMTKLKPTTRASYDSLLKHQILPLLGERPVKDLSVKDVRILHRKTVESGHETSATRAVAVLYSLLRAAEENEDAGWRTDDSKTWKGFKLPGGNERKRTLQPLELAELEAALVTLVAAGQAEKTGVKVDRLDPQAADLIRFLALSGLRKSEALGLRFADVDLERGTMTFKDHKTSGEAGVKVLPLNTHLRAILQQRASQKLGAYVFPGRLLSGDPIVGLSKMWERVVEAAGLEDVTPHDLRRTFYSTAVKLTLSFDVADILTGHSLPKVRRVYGIDPYESPIVIQASQDTADWVAAAMAGAQVKPGVKITTEAMTQGGTA